jgi:hypothetical protein
MRRRTYSRVGLLAGLALLAVRPAAGEVVVAVNEGRVALTARSAPLSEVLDRLARQTHMQVTYEGAPPRHLVTAALQSATPAQAVLSVLEGLGVSYALQLDDTGSEVQTLLLIAAKAGASGAAGSPTGVPQPSVGRVPPPPPPPPFDDDEEGDIMEEDDEPPVEMRPDRGGRGRPGRERPNRPGVFDPAVPPQAMPFPGGAPATPVYPVSPFAPVPTLPQAVVPPPGIQPVQPPPPENDPDS